MSGFGQFDTIQIDHKCCCGIGSISLNGISLTINEVKSNKCHCMIIPHTYKHTDIHTYKKNEILNLEVDMLARYAHTSKSQVIKGCMMY